MPAQPEDDEEPARDLQANQPRRRPSWRAVTIWILSLLVLAALVYLLLAFVLASADREPEVGPAGIGLVGAWQEMLPYIPLMRVS